MSLKTVLSELNQLESSGVVGRFAIGGAVGALHYLPVASTEDVDVFVTFNPETGNSLTPLAPIYEYLTRRGAVPKDGHLVIGSWPVQFLPASGPLLEEAIAEALDLDVEGEHTRIFSAEHLAAIALNTGRAKDKARLLQMLEAKALDLQRFKAIVARHDLVPQWERFAVQFPEAM
jgi:hypothetical protein